MASLAPDEVVLVPRRDRERIERAAGRQSSIERLPLKSECSVEYRLARGVEWNDGDVEMVLPCKLPVTLPEKVG
jgi:hypothetical protein